MNPFTPRRRPATIRLALRDGVIVALSIVAGGALGLAGTTIAIETGLVPGVSIGSFPYQAAGTSVTVHVSAAPRPRSLSPGAPRSAAPPASRSTPRTAPAGPRRAAAR